MGQLARQDVEHFYHALIGSREYRSANSAIRNVEHFLCDWLNEEETEFKQENMALLTDICTLFSYCGTLYRGIRIDEEQYEQRGLRYTGFSSFSDVEEVAMNFAGSGKRIWYPEEANMRHFILEGNVESALALDDLLDAVTNKSDNNLLILTIEERIWENEKIALCSLEDFSIRELTKEVLMAS